MMAFVSFHFFLFSFLPFWGRGSPARLSQACLWGVWRPPSRGPRMQPRLAGLAPLGGRRRPLRLAGTGKTQEVAAAAPRVVRGSLQAWGRVPTRAPGRGGVRSERCVRWRLRLSRSPDHHDPVSGHSASADRDRHGGTAPIVGAAGGQPEHMVGPAAGAPQPHLGASGPRAHGPQGLRGCGAEALFGENRREGAALRSQTRTGSGAGRRLAELCPRRTASCP